MWFKTIFLIILTTLLFSAAPYANGVTTVYIDVVGEAEFEVFYDRALSNATGAVIAGLIGAGIQSGVESSNDAAKTRELLPLVSKDAWKTRFLDTLNETLESNGFEAVWVDTSRGIGDGIILKIYPEEYGFKIVDTSTRMVSAFIAFKATFSTGHPGDDNGRENEKKKYYITNKNQHPYDELLMEDSPVNSELEAVLVKAARRLANKIIYSVKE